MLSEIKSAKEFGLVWDDEPTCNISRSIAHLCRRSTALNFTYVINWGLRQNRSVILSSAMLFHRCHIGSLRFVP